MGKKSHAALCAAVALKKPESLRRQFWGEKGDISHTKMHKDETVDFDKKNCTPLSTLLISLFFLPHIIRIFRLAHIFSLCPGLFFLCVDAKH